MTVQLIDSIAPIGVPVTKEVLATLCKDIEEGHGLPLMFVNGAGDYQMITAEFIKEALTEVERKD